jgi:hypothetical protein
MSETAVITAEAAYGTPLDGAHAPRRWSRSPRTSTHRLRPYFLLTGHPPFTGNNIGSRSAPLISTRSRSPLEPARRHRCRASSTRLVRCLEKDPERRRRRAISAVAARCARTIATARPVRGSSVNRALLGRVVQPSHEEATEPGLSQMR